MACSAKLNYSISVCNSVEQNRLAQTIASAESRQMIHWGEMVSLLKIILKGAFGKYAGLKPSGRLKKKKNELIV